MHPEPNPIAEELDLDESRQPPDNSKQKVIVALLLVGLMIAILTQPASDKPADNVDPMVSLKLDVEPVLAMTESGFTVNSFSQFSQVNELSRLSLDDAINSPMFMADQATMQRIAAESTKVKAVYGTTSLQSALVGKSIIHSGQVLPDGRTVRTVNTNGVQVEVQSR